MVTKYILLSFIAIIYIKSYPHYTNLLLRMTKDSLFMINISYSIYLFIFSQSCYIWFCYIIISMPPTATFNIYYIYYVI
jgi:hypothetical protein